MPRPTLRQIARKAGVSLSTVSYALRQHANVSRETQERIASVAAELGYTTDPRLMSLMAHVRAARLDAQREVLALVWPEQSKEVTRESTYFYWVREGVRRRAGQLGFAVEEFWPHQEHMPLGRLLDVLFARGIYGLVFASTLHPPTGIESADFSRVAVAKIGLAEWPVRFHLSAHNHFMGMTLTMRELLAGGFRRPAALIRRHVHELNFGAYEAAFLQNHPGRDTQRGRRAAERLFMLLPDVHKIDIQGVCAWLTQEEPDVLVCSDIEAWPKSMSGRMPQMRWASLLRAENVGGAGVDQEYEQIAANAVDLVMEQLNRNERGVPAAPKMLLTNGRWCGW
ncbi:LacI family DNA-binding transcriptional regulator [Geminisphaera colitermitum]|uniref:LacI family DNA-binding transcriptional regulator n=1 Tax=Geminisphaera colitermitum TaxID=1148786 RepID=UPI000693D58A|nr:LacI family DNA-binding transcriptional regulator [Geminisphaera colitermitum]